MREAKIWVKIQYVELGTNHIKYEAPKIGDWLTVRARKKDGCAYNNHNCSHDQPKLDYSKKMEIKLMLRFENSTLPIPNI